jgi:hypothetical protein
MRKVVVLMVLEAVLLADQQVALAVAPLAYPKEE